MDTPKLNVGDKVRFKNYDDPNGTPMHRVRNKRWYANDFSGVLLIISITNNSADVREFDTRYVTGDIPLSELELVEADLSTFR